MLACKYHSFPIYFSFEFNVVSIERKNFPIEVKLVNASMYQKRPILRQISMFVEVLRFRVN